MKRPVVMMMAGILGAAIFAGPALAVNRLWDTAEDGDYHDNSKWGDNPYPVAGDRAYFPQDGSYTVTINQNVTNDMGRFYANDATVRVDIANGREWYFANGWRDSLTVSEAHNTSNIVLVTGGSLTNGGRRLGNGTNTYALLTYSNVTDTLAGTPSLAIAQATDAVAELRLTSGSSIYASGGGTIGVGTGNRSTGTLLVDDSSLTDSLGANKEFGKNGGHGVLTLTNNAVVDFDTTWLLMAYTGSSAELNMHGGTLTCHEVQIPIQADGTGTVNVTGGTINCTGRDFRLANNSGPCNMQMSGGTINAPNGAFDVGLNDSAVVDCTVSGGTITADSLGLGNASTLTLSGGTIDVTGDDRDDFRYYSKLTIIGTNTEIRIGGYLIPEDSSETEFLFSHGGVSPIQIFTNAASVNSDADLNQANPAETLTLRLNGYMASLPSSEIVLITSDKTGNSYRGDFGIKDLGIFTVPGTGEDYTATLDAAEEVPGSPLTLGGTIELATPANTGWIDINNSGMSGTVNINVLLSYSGASKDQDDLIADMRAAGLDVVEEPRGPETWLTIATPAPSWSDPAFAWDLSEFDPNVKITALRAGDFGDYGTVISIR